ncbi:MAG: hypothetical protein JXB48_11160 [Candidatus Latescibacteria bacterium]|nr:hypothetical protein [Candidatus Latescibacterota bacterium]
MKLSNHITFSIIIFLLVWVTGCSNKPGTKMIETRIVAVGSGRTTGTKEFKATGEKPIPFVIWGNDVRDGAQCDIVISNVTKGQAVYRRTFIHDTDTKGDRINFERSKIIEKNAQWNRQIGNYYMELYIDGKKKDTYKFFIRP